MGATPVWIVPDSELKRNGGQIPVQGGAAVPLANPAGSASGSITVKEQDGSPSVDNVTVIKVANGTLTDDGSGVVSIDTGLVVDPAFTPMVNDDFAWVNQGSASVVVSDDTVFLLAPAGSGHNVRIRKKTAPATPYTVTVALRINAYPKQYGTAGILWRQSSDGKLVTFHVTVVDSSGLHLVSTKYTNPTTTSTDYFTGNLGASGAFLWLRIADDGTNRICSISTDGRNFIQIHSVGRTDFLTADEVGIFANCNNGGVGDVGMTVYSWVEA